MGYSMATLEEKINTFLDFGFQALIKIGVVGALIPLVFVILRAQDHYGHVRTEAEIIGAAVRCDISEPGARAIGKQGGWWDCAAATDLQRANPKVPLGIMSSELVTYRFNDAKGEVRTVSVPMTVFDMGRPEPGLIVPILYSPVDPTRVKAVLRLEHWAFLSFLGLSGLMIGAAGWQLRTGRAEMAAKVPAKTPTRPPLRSSGRSLGLG